MDVFLDPYSLKAYSVERVAKATVDTSAMRRVTLADREVDDVIFAVESGDGESVVTGFLHAAAEWARARIERNVTIQCYQLLR